MSTLNKTQRNSLENAVVKARQLAERGAAKALHNLAVDQPEPYSHMSPEMRELRRPLRNKARLLGDRNTNGSQEMGKLSYELAYEYWHRMLFARFLEANHLLIHPQHELAVSLEECAEFAVEEGYADKWAAAAQYASRMLPAIFRPEDPLMQVEFATEDRLALERLLEGIDSPIFQAVDSLGWVYQYWQSEAKTTINASGDKIDGERLPAVTQLFTEPYMVHFLIDNSLGAWWVSRNPNKLPPLKFEYLRKREDGTPAAGSFEDWPETTKEITVIDPCMGSGHFMVELFLVLAPLRIQEEGLDKVEAARRVIAENLHGLEIDPRCTQIAAFNLALTAWKFCGRYLELPEMNLACSGLAPRGKIDQWVKLVGKVHPDDQTRMENGMRALYDHFQLAPELGSLLDPSMVEADAFTASFQDLRPVLQQALSSEDDKDEIERGVMAAGIARAGELLDESYTLIITNVPYLSRGKQDKVMADFALKHYPAAKGDLATIFLENLLKKCSGTVCTVIPQNWLFLTTYRKFRENLLKDHTWGVVARLGSGAFSQISGEVVKAILLSIDKAKPTSGVSFTGLDVSERGNVSEKDYALIDEELKVISQAAQLENPDARVVLETNKHNTPYLSKYSNAYIGLHVGGWEAFKRGFWELKSVDETWTFVQGSVDGERLFSGLESIAYWPNDGLIHEQNPNARVQGKQAWGKRGLITSPMGTLPFAIYLGEIFDNNTCTIIPKDDKHLPAIWCFCSSPRFNEEIRKIDQNLKVTNATLVKVPFDLEHWQKVADEKYPNGLPKPYSEDPTQWLFHGHPKYAENPLQVALARILGYRWPAESDEVMELDQKARDHIAEIQAFDHLSDDDGIICIPPVNGEKPAAESLRNYMRQVWGSEWDNHTLTSLLRSEESKKATLEQWLRDEFFIRHCKVFNNRPFLWHIWDGRKDGFAALVNYHQLNRANLKKLIYTYLNDWIRQCELKVRDNESGADGMLMAARQLKDKLELILEGEPPYDIFVRWKPLHEQPIGWEPDLNDGVRLNIYPFMQAGVLHKNPNIKWGKDRGKNPEGSHWGPDRYNRYEDLDDQYKLRDKEGKVVECLRNEAKLKARANNHKSQ